MISVETELDELLTSDDGSPAVNDRDFSGTPLNPVFRAAVYTTDPDLLARSVFTDLGPIAKPILTVQSGFGALIQSPTEVSLPGAQLVPTFVGLYLELGQRGVPTVTSSSVVDDEVTLSDTISLVDTLVVDVVRPSSSQVVYRTLRGTYKILEVLSSTRARVQASFTLPEGGNGQFDWAVVNPRHGQIADDSADVVVRVNGSVIQPEAVVGLLGQVVLPIRPSATDDVRIDYSWCPNPIVEYRRTNSREFRFNAWNSNRGVGLFDQHKYRYNNISLRPSAYASLHSVGRQHQPRLRSLSYRAYERAYTPVTNDPTTLLLNSPKHKIAYPSAKRILSEEFLTYDGGVLPEASLKPWVRQGLGIATTSSGILTVTDNSSGVFPDGDTLFWRHPIDLTFPNAFALSWRMAITSVPTLEGVFTGVATGYSDELNVYVVGFIDVAGVKKVGFLRRNFADVWSTETSWVGGLDSDSLPTGAPVAFDWGATHSYRLFRDPSGVVHLLVDGNILDSLRITPAEAPFLEEVNARFDGLQGVFFGSISRVAESSSEWDFVRYLSLPTNPVQTNPSSFVTYAGTTLPEIAPKPWTPVGYHGTETLSGGFLVLDSTSATDAGTSVQVGLVGGDFRGFLRMEPLLRSASQVTLDVRVQLRTQTHGLDPYGLMFAVDDGTCLIQVSFLTSQATPKLSYGGRTFPEDFVPYSWTPLGEASSVMLGRVLQIVDSTATTGRVYVIEDLAPPTSDDRVVALDTDYSLEFRCRVISYSPDVSGFAGVCGQVSDGSRSLGVMLEDVGGVKYATLHSDGLPLPSGRFAFNWGAQYHTYRMVKNTAGNLVSLFVDGAFVGSLAYSTFTSTPGSAVVSFGSSTAASVGSRSVVDWAYCNAWRSRGDLRRYVGIWKGFDDHSLTGYHLPVKASGRGAQIVGNVLADSMADFGEVLTGDALIVDIGPNKGTYTVVSVIDAHTLTILGVWPSSPSLVAYRIARETDWSTMHRYRISKDSSGEVSLLLDTLPDALIRVGYNSVDLPENGKGIVSTLSNGLASVVFGAFSPENLSQSAWDLVSYGITRTPMEREIAPHHQVTNQWNVMESPERLTTTIPHTLTINRSSSTGITPNLVPDFLDTPKLKTFTQLNDSTPLVPSTQTFQVRKPYPLQASVAALADPSTVMDTPNFTITDGDTQYKLILPDDILYSSLQVHEQTSGDEAAITPYAEGGISGLRIHYTGQSCLRYLGDTLPEEDPTAPTPWTRHSDVPSDVMAHVAGGILTYQTIGSRTAYVNNTALPDAPSLTTEVRFRIRLVDDASLGSGDTQVRFGLSAPGLTIAIAFVTTVAAERYVLIVDLNSGKYLGAANFNFLDGNFHTYRILRNPGAGIVQVFIDS